MVDDMKELRAAVQAANIVDCRYPEEYMSAIEFDSIPLNGRGIKARPG